MLNSFQTLQIQSSLNFKKYYFLYLFLILYLLY